MAIRSELGADGRGVVLTAWAHVGGPQRPPVGGRDDLDVAAVVAMLARPPQVYAGFGPGVAIRSVAINVPSRTWLCPAAFAASSAPCRLGACGRPAR